VTEVQEVRKKVDVESLSKITYEELIKATKTYQMLSSLSHFLL
jgi:hypothetical protein